MANEVTVMLSQQNSFGRECEFKLMNGRELHIINKNKRSQSEYCIDIVALSRKSKRKITIAWLWLITGLITLLTTILIVKYLPQLTSAKQNLYVEFALFVGLLGSVVFFVLFWVQTSRQQYFYSRHAHLPLVELMVGKPSTKQFAHFIQALERHIKELREHIKLTKDQQLAGEMKMLRRLNQQGVLHKADYEKAKKILFRQHQ